MSEGIKKKDQTTGPLSGIKVLELGSMLAGPFCGTMLADFGADVIKVEKPGTPDPLRQWPPFKNGEELLWRSMARGKQTITLDISKPEGCNIAKNLIGLSDIVIENFRPGTLERWGFNPSELASNAGGAVWVRVSGYGQSGPMKNEGGYATIAESFSGLASFTGYKNRGPMVSPFPMADYLAGVFSAFGALAALNEKQHSGFGQIVDTALYEPLLRIIETAVLRWDQNKEMKKRLGNQMEEDVPRNIYKTRDDEYVSLSIGSDQLFQSLLDAMERFDLKTDKRYTTMADRVQNRNTIDAEVAKWFGQNDAATILDKMAKHRVIVGKVHNIEDIFNNSHIKAREMIAELLEPKLGMIKMPAPVPKLTRTPGKIRWAGKPMGADNYEVFHRLLGLSEKEIQKLSVNRII